MPAVALCSGAALGAALALLAERASRSRESPAPVANQAPPQRPAASGTGKPTTCGIEDEASSMSMGFSMKDALEQAEAGQAAAMKRSPHEVLAELQKGNARFWMGNASRPEKSAFERRSLISRQFPSTAVLGCADSRVPVEIVFDQGLGDLFVVRVAGNCLDTTTTASLEFAVNHLKVKVLLVMGHEACGAIKAAQLPESAIDKEPKALGSLLKSLKNNLDTHGLGHVRDPRAQDREAVTSNVRAQVEALLADESIMAKVKSKELLIVGTFYEISSGIVDFFHEVSDLDKGPIAPSRGVLSRCDTRM